MRRHGRELRGTGTEPVSPLARSVEDYLPLLAEWEYPAMVTANMAPASTARYELAFTLPIVGQPTSRAFGKDALSAWLNEL